MKKRVELTPLQEQMVNELFPLSEKNERLGKIFLIGILASVVLTIIFLPMGLPLLMVALIGRLFVWASSAGISYRRKTLIACLKEAEQRGELNALWNDYRNAEGYLGMKLGQRYIVSFNTGVVVRYDEIRNVHQYVHKTNLIEDGRELRAIKTDGETVTLTGLELRGKADEHVQKVIAFLMMKNPSITVGC